MKTIAFDWDGTLADTIPDVIDAVQRLAIIRQLPVPSPTDIRPLIGMQVHEILSALFPPVDPQSLIDDYRRISTTYIPRLYASTSHVLSELSLRHRLVLATSRSEAGIHRHLDLTATSKFFTYVLTAEKTAPKPDPCMLISVSADVYIGDALLDADTARAANCKFIAATYGATSKSKFNAHGCEDTISDIKEICNHSFVL